jgi:hypothetical protein
MFRQRNQSVPNASKLGELDLGYTHVATFSRVSILRFLRDRADRSKFCHNFANSALHAKFRPPAPSDSHAAGSFWRTCRWPRRTKNEYVRLASAMGLRLCRVTVSDLEEVRHSVGVTASTLSDAVALGLAAVRGEEWAGEIAEGLSSVDVTVTAVPVTHSVAVRGFQEVAGSERQSAQGGHSPAPRSPDSRAGWDDF